MSLFSGLGTAIGAGMGSADLSAAQGQVGGLASDFLKQDQPFITFGSNFLQPTSSVLLGSDGSGAGSNPTIGLSRLQGNGNDVTQFEPFMQNFSMSPGGKYLTQTGMQSLDNSAAARGGLLSGANLRAGANLSEGIANTDMLSQYNAYLAGNNQQFQQLQGSLQDMFGGIGVGQTGVGQYGSVVSSEMMAQAQMAAAQAQSAAAKGGGMGQALGGLGGMAAKF